ncbi:MAG: hypothetical protein US53_C0001G0010 [Candidatus Woesebacteria bacterium GW2011_GWA1_37_7]|uniref:Metal-dependent hydrolase n=1 Tax=Candidatus Woesebacteria bacterium GW2011_GWA1_37_7 TaxID=1618545 RepID=A0A0G0HHW8_9BACT|nr:MAG: hypothetical protein US53_C0001G0010 [Candidatus Woesebacteria bacterium GW2011_GWA1_37_7]
MSNISPNFILQEMIHGIFAIPFAYIIFIKTRSLKSALFVILLTYLLDLDHLLDYFLYFGFKFNVFDFISASYFLNTKRAIVPFHAWEWTLLLFPLSYRKGWRSVFTILLFALIPHLIYDSLVVGSFVFYSIIYRGLKGFVNIN